VPRIQEVSLKRCLTPIRILQQGLIKVAGSHIVFLIGDLLKKECTVVAQIDPTREDARHKTRSWPAQSGCIFHDLRLKLKSSGLRPTRQRVGLGWLLFAKGDRHVTAEMLYEEALKARLPVSLATVYNTLHQFTESGLLREIAVDGAKTHFDTNTGNHYHFFIEDDNTIVDIQEANLEVSELPTLPEGMEISRVDVIIRLRRKVG
jgi:Fur family iron response transcriptional regulator